MGIGLVVAVTSRAGHERRGYYRLLEMHVECIDIPAIHMPSNFNHSEVGTEKYYYEPQQPPGVKHLSNAECDAGFRAAITLLSYFLNADFRSAS